MVNLLSAGGQLGLGTAVNDVDLSAQTLGAAGSIHGHVAAAHNGDLLVMQDGSLAVGQVGLHQVDAGEVLVGGVHAYQGLARDLHKHGQAGTGTDEHGLIAHLKQLGDGQYLADDHVQLDVHTHLLQVGHLTHNNGLGQTELRDAVAQHAARQVECLKHGDRVALACQLAGTGQTCGAGADHGHLAAVLGRSGHVGDVVGSGPVGHKALHTADGHRLALDAADTLALALVLLRADAAGNGRQCVGVGEDLISAGKILLSYLTQELGDGNAHRATGDAQRILALQAALGLVHRLLGGVAQGHFLKVTVADIGLLLRHGGLVHLHISHSWHLLPGGKRASLSPLPPALCK